MGTKPQKAAVPSSSLVNNLHAASSICVYIFYFCGFQIVRLFWQALFSFFFSFPETF